MFTCLAQHAIGVTLPWESCLPLARQAGFQGIDLEIDPKKSAAHYCEKFAEYGLRCGGMSLPVNFRGKQPEYEAGLSKLRQVAPLAREIGLSRFYTWILSFSDMLTYKQNLAFHAEHLGPAAKILADHGCTLGLEFLGPRSLRVGHRYPFVHTLEQMLDLCEQVGPNCGLLLDSWPWYTSLGTLEDLRARSSTFTSTTLRSA
jgi:sugar phosphate isomerase/epimerase